MNLQTSHSDVDAAGVLIADTNSQQRLTRMIPQTAKVTGGQAWRHLCNLTTLFSPRLPFAIHKTKGTHTKGQKKKKERGSSNQKKKERMKKKSKRESDGKCEMVEGLMEQDRQRVSAE